MPSRRSTSPSRIGDSFSRTWSWTFFGGAELMQGRWEEAIEALERALAMSREHRTAVEGNTWILFWLAEAYLGLGKDAGPWSLVREGIETARGARAPGGEAFGTPGPGAGLLAAKTAAASVEIEEALDQALEFGSGDRVRELEPLIHVELAELARLRGDESEHERELREAHRLFTEIGARATPTASPASWRRWRASVARASGGP